MGYWDDFLSKFSQGVNASVGADVPTPGMTINNTSTMQPYGPQLPHYGPAHAGGSPTNPIIATPYQGTVGPGDETAASTATNPLQLGQAPKILPHLYGQGGNQSILPYLFGGPPAIGSPAPAIPPPRPADLGQARAAPMQARPAPNLGYGIGSPNMDNAALGDQMMGGGAFGGGQAPPQPQAQPQGPPFTMVLRPNAPANQGGRGGGGTPLATALDLSSLFNHPEVAQAAAAHPAVQGALAHSSARAAVPAPKVARARAQAPGWPLPQVRPGGAAGVVPTFFNPAYGQGANVGLGN